MDYRATDEKSKKLKKKKIFRFNRGSNRFAKPINENM
jgi:hypothetical protein